MARTLRAFFQLASRAESSIGHEWLVEYVRRLVCPARPICPGRRDGIELINSLVELTASMKTLSFSRIFPLFPRKIPSKYTWNFSLNRIKTLPRARINLKTSLPRHPQQPETIYLGAHNFLSFSSYRTFEELSILPNGTVNTLYRPLVLSMYHQYVCKYHLTPTGDISLLSSTRLDTFSPSPSALITSGEVPWTFSLLSRSPPAPFGGKRNFANHRNVSFANSLKLRWKKRNKSAERRSNSDLTHFMSFSRSAMARVIPTRAIAFSKWWSAHRGSTVADTADRRLPRWVIGTILRPSLGFF